MTFEDILGYVFGAGALAAALGVVLRRDAVVAAMNLVLAFFCLSGVYLLLGFPFLAAVQVLVYAGAIMVLFLFVIMLLGISTLARTPIGARSGVGLAVAIAILMETTIVGIELATSGNTGAASMPQKPPAESVLGVSTLLFQGKLVLAFEITGVVLLAAMVGVVVLARRDLRVAGTAEYARERAFVPGPLVGLAPKPSVPDGLADSQTATAQISQIPGAQLPAAPETAHAEPNSALPIQAEPVA
jgi:NADH-quinone oxidoreductase subunit J